MRAIALLIALTLLPSPALARDRKRSRSARSAEVTGARDARPAPPPAPGRAVAPAPAAPGWSRGGAPAPYPYRERLRPARVYVAGAVPFWIGWGWGWGYYPLYPRPPYDPGRNDEAERIATRLSFAGAVEPDGAVGGVALAVEGRALGFDVDVNALAIDRRDGTGSSDALGWGSAHATFTFASSEVFRARLELGGSMLSMPDRGAYAGRPYAGTVAFGPDIGISAQLGLVGPVGLEGHARFTPYPVPITDLRLALALRGGPFAVTVGGRTIDIAGNEDDGPDARFSGPELGFSILF